MQLHCLELPCRACPGSAGEIIHAAKIPVSRTLRGSWTPPSNPLADHHHPWGTVGESGHKSNLPGSEPRPVTPKPMFFLLPGFPITAIRSRVGKRTLPTPPFVFTGDFLPCRPTQHQPTRVPQSPPSPWPPASLPPAKKKTDCLGEARLWSRDSQLDCKGRATGGNGLDAAFAEQAHFLEAVWVLA